MITKFNADSLVGNIELPSSKSISNRVLMIRALCDHAFAIENLSTANDTVLLNQLLLKIKRSKESTSLEIEDAGTPFRLLTAFCAIQEGREFTLSGSERMKQRPIQELVEALQALGADITYLDKFGFPNLLIKGKRLKGGQITISGKTSSQFISALCLIAPLLEDGLSICIIDEIVSDAYIQMTLDIMSEFGILYSRKNQVITIPHQDYIPRDYAVENDWSSATFFYAMAFLSNNVDIKMKGLYENSFQGDSSIKNIAEQFGIRTQFHNDLCIIKRMSPIAEINSQIFNFLSHPDLAIPLIVAFAIQYPNIQISGIHHLELKESNRIHALQTQLSKIGIHLEYANNLLSFQKELEKEYLNQVIHFESFSDHRIVMSLTLLAIKGYQIKFDNITCVKKPFPDFFQQIERLGFQQIAQ